MTWPGTIEIVLSCALRTPPYILAKSSTQFLLQLFCLVMPQNIRLGVAPVAE